MIYHSNKFNKIYLRQCFHWAFKNNLKLPVYEILPDESISCIPEEKFVLMIVGNENHLNLDHFYEDSRVAAIVKNYPCMLNHHPEKGQAYQVIVDSNNKMWFKTEKEDDRTLNIPMGPWDDFTHYVLPQREYIGGFTGQWTKIREDCVLKINKIFGKEKFKFKFYKGFGPFIQGKKSLNQLDYSYELSNFEISFCFGGQSPETYRLFESAITGCAIISTPLPYTWYYKDIPTITMTNMDSEDDVLKKVSFLLEKENRFGGF